MAKRKTTATKIKLDMMSVTVLLVMTIFGGIIGYYLGQGAAASQFANVMMNTAVVKTAAK
jgi:hypothetical protein